MLWNTIQYDSPLLGRTVEFLLGQPENEGRFPAAYLHHGLGDTYRAFLDRSDLKRLSNGLQMILVLPDAGRSWGCDDPREDGFPWDQHLTVELVDYVDANFPTIARSEARGQAGFSMGGYEAMMFALRRPDRFGAVYTVAGSFLFGHEYREDRPERTAFMQAVAPPDGPYDLFRVASDLAAQGVGTPEMAIDIGLDDHLLKANRRFKELLDDLKIKHTYEEFAGAHRWATVNERLPKLLEFMQKQLAEPELE